MHRIRQSRAYLNGGSRVRSLGDLDLRDVGEIPEVVHQVVPESVHGLWKEKKIQVKEDTRSR